MRSKNPAMGHLLAAFTAFVWGTTFVSSKVLLNDFTPVELLFYRFLLGYATLWVIRPRKLILREKNQELLFAGAGLSGVTLYYLAENLALTHTQATNVSVIVSTAPLFVSILAYFYLKEEKLQKYFLIGFLCAIIGIVLLSFGGGEQVQVHLLGDSLCIGAALLWGIYSILIRKIHTYEYPVIEVTRRIFFYGLLYMIPVVAVSDFQIGLSRFLDPTNLGNLLFLGVVGCALCFVIWNRAVDILGAIKTSAYIYAIPVITIVVSVTVLGETITPIMAVGTVLTVIGLMISEKK